MVLKLEHKIIICNDIIISIGFDGRPYVRIVHAATNNYIASIFFKDEEDRDKVYEQLFALTKEPVKIYDISAYDYFITSVT